MTNMIGLCAHGSLAGAFLEAIGMIAGLPEGVCAFPLTPGMEPLEYRAKVEDWIDNHPSANFLLLTDLFGGTPCNMAATFAKRENVAVIAGMNLSMVIEVLTRKDQVDLEGLCDIALGIGCSGIIDVKKRLGCLQE